MAGLLALLLSDALPVTVTVVFVAIVAWPHRRAHYHRASNFFFLRRVRAQERRRPSSLGSGQVDGSAVPQRAPSTWVGVERSPAPPAPSAPAGAVPPSRACRARPLTSATRYVQVADVRTPAPVGTRRTSVTESACPPASTSANTGRMPPASPVPAGLGRKVTDG